ncbi:MAG: HDIG domain-containing protein [Candidatus Omnitrophica bacterium]|nr:HDIG domain-containing protein [Candidatus Omnitrophota bacterium]
MNNVLTTKGNIWGFLRHRDMVSVLLLGTFLVLAMTSIFVNPQLYQRSIHEGDIALKDTYAPYDFSYEWDVEKEMTQAARTEAADKVPYFIRRNAKAGKEAISKLEGFFAAMDAESSSEISLPEKIEGVKRRTGIDIPDKKYKILLEDGDKAELKSTVISATEKVLQTGFISDSALTALKKKGVESVVIFDTDPAAGIGRALDHLCRSDNIQTVIDEAIGEYPGDKKRIKQVAPVLIEKYLKPNLEPDEKVTAAEREKAVSAVSPVYHVWEVKKNELVIGKGERVNARHIAQLSRLRNFLREGKSKIFFLGTLLLFFILGFLGFIYMKCTRRLNFLDQPGELAIILSNMLFMIVLVDFIMRGPAPSYFIPMAGMGMMIMLLIDFNSAFLCVTLMCFLVAILTGGKVEVALVLMTGSMMGMYAARGARRRVNILWAGLLAGLAKFVAIVSAGLINGIAMNIYVKDGVWGISSGILSGVIVMVFLPVFEHIFKVPTNISLLEMSDLNHPLLKKMALEAPGTYHHSIMVGNLSEAACDSIGANSLLTRVGSYYHDIGKLPKPQYYSENEMGESSKHGGLTSSMSALIIAKHVKQGVELAKQYKLNPTIIDFIRQHHGTSLIAYFYQKAIEKAKDGDILDEDNFRYPGPKPQTKEAAIVLLADSVEASSRSLADPTPSRISNLVRKVVNNKFIDGQLEECDLTLKDMHQIADAFVRVLMAVFHTRTSYPDDKAAQNNERSNGRNNLRK